MVLTITIGGLHGTGKTTVAEMLARNLGLRHVSAGELFRRIAKERGLSLSDLSMKASEKDHLDKLVDERTKEEAQKGGAVIDGQLAAWMGGENVDLKFFLFASEEVRLARIARRDRCTREEAKRATYLREDLERRRFKKFYGIDIDDRSIYDLTLNTGLLSPRGNVQILECFARAYMKERRLP